MICRKGADKIRHAGGASRADLVDYLSEDGALVAVKTDRAIPKELVFEVMRVINSSAVPKDVGVGYTVVEGVLGTDASIVVTSEKYR